MKKVFTIFTLFIFIILLSSCKPNDNVFKSWDYSRNNYGMGIFV